MKTRSLSRPSRAQSGGDLIFPAVQRPQFNEGSTFEASSIPNGMEQMAASSPNPKPNQKQVYETTPVSARRSFRSTSILPNNITTPRGQASTLPDINRLMISPPAQKKLAGGAGAQEGAVQKIYLRGLSVDVGLENLGNTCFMNSILQCLLHIDSFVEHFMTRDINMEINKSSPTRGTLATSFAQLVADIRNSSSGVVISPANFQKAVSRYAPHLLDYQQQDCQEFLRFLLDGISEDLCRKSDSLCTPAKSGRLSFSSSNDSLPQSHTTPVVVEGVRRVSMRSPALQSSAATAVSMLNGQSKSSSVMKLRAEVALNSPDSIRSSAAVPAGGAAPNNVVNNQEYEVANHLSKAGTGLKSARPLPTISDSKLTNRAEEHQQHQHQSVATNSGSSVSNLPDSGIATVTVVSSNQAVHHVAEAGESGDRTESNTNSSVAGQAAVECPESVVLSEARKAWKAYLRLNNSVVTDIFAGLLQSTVECLTCHNRSYCFDPFLDLSVPIPKPAGGESRISSWRRSSSSGAAAKCTLEDCLIKFVGEEMMEGDNMIKCEKCDAKRRCSKKLSVFRFPKVLVIHIKRFRYSNVSREKLSTDVTFPLTGLDLSPYLSNDRPAAANNKEGATTAAATATNASGVVSPQQNPVYDLAGIANHIGTMNGGHYVSHINVNGGGSGSRWMCFNDERISVANTNTMCGPSAYVLFYRLRENSAT